MHQKMSSTDVELVGRQGLLESVVNAAKTCNKLFLNNCNMCTVYCDQQVQYEWVQENSINPMAMESLFKRMGNGLEVQVYKEFLFDEESVVEHVIDRQEQ
jgi:hypothetical protein